MLKIISVFEMLTEEVSANVMMSIEHFDVIMYELNPSNPTILLVLLYCINYLGTREGSL